MSSQSGFKARSATTVALVAALFLLSGFWLTIAVSGIAIFFSVLIGRQRR